VELPPPADGEAQRRQAPPGPTLPPETPAASAAAAAAQALEPMPVEAPPGFFGGLPYVFKVWGARRRRASVIRAFKREIAVEERKLDEILRDLGKRVRELNLSYGPLDAELQALHSLEQQRGEAESGKVELQARLKAEEEQFAKSDADCQARIQSAQEQVNTVQAALNEKMAEQRQVRAELAQHDKQLKTLTAQRDARRGQAAKAKDDQREGLEQAAAELAVQIGDVERERETVAAQAASLEAPIAELSANLTTWRTNLQTAQKELATAKQTLAAAKREVGGEERKKGLEIAQVEKQVAQKFLDIGRILESSRLENPAFEELYGRVDETRTAIGTRQQQISQLEGERDAYDRQAAKNGKILLLIGAGLVVAVVATLVILFAFVLD
jgi:chromosome segregation ATPase